MEEKKETKLVLKKNVKIILGCILVILIAIFVYNIYFFKSSYTNGKSKTIYSNIKIKTGGEAINYIVKTGYSSGREECVENTFVTSYEELEEYINKYDKVEINDEDVLEIFDEEFFENNTLAIEAYDASLGKNHYVIESVKKDGKKVNIDITHTEYSFGGILAPSTEFKFIILDKNIKSVNFNITAKKINNNWNHPTIDKPIIYIYPTMDMEVSVKLGYKERVTVSYPKYIDSWNVLAKKDGSLVDLNTNRNLYALYYESESIVPFKQQAEGFVVKGEDSAEFLEEKLEILGLNEREAEEFIIYWLPKLEVNKYNYIRFATTEEIANNMPLNISPNPDTVIRVLMTFKGLEEEITVKKQQLKTPERKGFTVVEWGGTEIK